MKKQKDLFEKNIWIEETNEYLNNDIISRIEQILSDDKYFDDINIENINSENRKNVDKAINDLNSMREYLINCFWNNDENVRYKVANNLDEFILSFKKIDNDLYLKIRDYFTMLYYFSSSENGLVEEINDIKKELIDEDKILSFIKRSANNDNYDWYILNWDDKDRTLVFRLLKRFYTIFQEFYSNLESLKYNIGSWEYKNRLKLDEEKDYHGLSKKLKSELDKFIKNFKSFDQKQITKDGIDMNLFNNYLKEISKLRKEEKEIGNFGSLNVFKIFEKILTLAKKTERDYLFSLINENNFLNKKWNWNDISNLRHTLTHKTSNIFELLKNNVFGEFYKLFFYINILFYEFLATFILLLDFLYKIVC